MMVTRLTTNPPQKAGQNPFTMNGRLNAVLDIQAAKYRSPALINNENKPRVTIKRPQDRNFNSGLINTFCNARIAAVTSTATHAEPSPTEIPGTIITATATAAAVINQRVKKFIRAPFSRFHVT